MLRRSLSLAEIAEKIGAKLDGPADREITGVASLRRASATEISFFSNRLYRNQLTQTQAGAIILAQSDRAWCPTAALVMDNPYLGYARTASLLNPRRSEFKPGVHPLACVDPAAQIAPTAWVGPHAVIEEHAEIGEYAQIGAGCIIGRHAVISDEAKTYPRSVLYFGVRIGRRVIIHAGAVIGSDGFGLANDGGQWVKVPQLGGVNIADDVEIGANTTIDRGSLEDTLIEKGVKLDNLIQIAHNVQIGEHTAIAGCVGVAGSTKIGRRCTIGGGVGIVGHIEIADCVHITGGSIVLQSILEPGVYSSGAPLQANRQWHRNYIRMKSLDELARRLQALEDQTK